ncbi:MAG: hypothetical protein V1495_00350 [Pseudomonadota bacterium]
MAKVVETEIIDASGLTGPQKRMVDVLPATRCNWIEKDIWNVEAANLADLAEECGGRVVNRNSSPFVVLGVFKNY